MVYEGICPSLCSGRAPFGLERNMRARLTVCGLVCLLLSIVFGSSTAVADDGYLDEASQGLQTSKVYASVSVRAIKAADVQSLVNQIGDAHVAVVVLPDTARADVGDGSDFLPRLMDRSGYSTVLVAVGGTFRARSTVLTRERLAPIVSKAQVGGIPAGLSSFVQEVKPLLATPTPHVPVPPQQENSGWPWWIWLVVGIAVSAVLAVVFIRPRLSALRPTSSAQYTPAQSPVSAPSSSGGFQRSSGWDNQFPGNPNPGP